MAGLSPTSFNLFPTSFHLSPRLGACPAGLSPTSFHLSPTSFHLSPSSFQGGFLWCWLVSHFLSFVSHFFSFVSQAGCLWSGSRLACLPLPFICLPLLFICPAGSCGWVCGWLVSHVLSFVSHFFHLSPSSFHLSPSSFHFWSPRLGACGRVPLSRICLLLLFTCLLSFHLSGSRPACLPLPFPLLFICLPVLFIVSGACGRGFAAGLSPTSFHLSPTSFHLSPTSFHSPNSLLLGVLNALKNGRLGAGWSGRVPGRLVSHFLLFVSHFFSFVSQARCLWSGSRLACLPLPFICLPLLFICLPVLFICLPGWVLVVGFPAGLSPTSFHLGSHFLSFVSHFFSFVSHFFSFVSQFFSFVSQAGYHLCNGPNQQGKNAA